MNKINILLLLIFATFSSLVNAQNESIVVRGVVANSEGNKLEYVNVKLQNYPNIGTITNKRGEYMLLIPNVKQKVIVFSIVGYDDFFFKVRDNLSSIQIVNPVLKKAIEQLGEVTVKTEKSLQQSFERVAKELSSIIPSFTGGVEDLIKTFSGVNSNNELSSQYSVRGGNFDENLVFVNDIEIYRPMLVRSGQQEGLSFVNPTMIQSIDFSAGGFDSKFGDKMSSVLDIRYKNPRKFGASVSTSLLGGDIHIEDFIKKAKLNYIISGRYKTNSYILNTLDDKGEYRPQFADIQALVNYRLDHKHVFSVMGYGAQNRYKYVPETRDTRFGTQSTMRRFKVYYSGQEEDLFNSAMGALTYNYRPKDDLSLKWIASIYRTYEHENFDILGEYLFTDVLFEEGGTSNVQQTLGVGGYHQYARNTLQATIFSLKHKGVHQTEDDLLEWGVTYKREDIEDKMREWERRDSSGYSTPYNDKKVLLYKTLREQNAIQSNRISAYLQNTHTRENSKGVLSFTSGLRLNYWDFNDEFLISPRVGLKWRPNQNKNTTYRLAAGYYQQPIFYKELKNLNGTINGDAKAQKSFQVLAGYDREFQIGSRPFKFTTEIYFKQLHDLIPYQIENIRIRYLSDQIADGYAAGVDMKINGEFVSGIQSWAGFSLLKTEEDIKGDGHGMLPRPTDQRFNFNLFIQDFLPSNPNFAAHLAAYVGGKLPFGAPNTQRYQQTLRMPLYRRLDIGFSKVFISREHDVVKRIKWRGIKDLRLTLDVFNILDIKNTSSYFWISDINGAEWAVPSYLTGRRINVKLSAKF